MGEAKKKEWSLKGMTALVTGGTKGIGHAIVEELAQFGASVHTCGRDKTGLDQCLHEWKESGFNVTGSVCDVSVRVAREKLMEEVSSLFQGKLNIFVSNAGILPGERTLEVTAEEYSNLMATNFESAYHLSQLAHPLLKASGQGSIVFISSVAGLVAIAVGIIYSATKGALNQLTKNLACEWAKDNIRTNCVAPYLTKTAMVDPDGFLTNITVDPSSFRAQELPARRLLQEIRPEKKDERIDFRVRIRYYPRLFGARNMPSLLGPLKRPP